MKHKLLILLPLTLMIVGCSVTTSTTSFSSSQLTTFSQSNSTSSDISVEPRGDNPFDYEGNYENSELTIDGKMDERQWTDENYSSGPYTLSGKVKDTDYAISAKVYLYKGEKELFVFYQVTDNTLYTNGDDNGNNVSFSDSCELYLDTLNDGGEKPQSDDFQINLGIHGKTRTLVGNGSGWSTWNGLVQYEVDLLGGVINSDTSVSTGYNLELAIPYKQLGIERDSQIGITFGIVNKYTSAAADYKWYGFSYKGVYGNPQVPNDYFIYKDSEVLVKGNTILSYESANDDITYYDGLPAIASNTKSNDTESRVSAPYNMKYFRDVNNLTLLIQTTKTKWEDIDRIQIYFDFGSPYNISRTSSMYYMYCFPSTGLVSAYYQFKAGSNGGDKSIGNRKLTTYISDQYFKIVIPFSTFGDGYEQKQFGIAYGARNTESIDIVSNQTTKTVYAESYSATTSNPTTFKWIDVDNTILDIISSDTTTYVDKDVNGYAIPTLESSNGYLSTSLAFDDLGLKVKIVNSVAIGDANDTMTFYFYSGDGTDTTRKDFKSFYFRFKLGGTYVGAYSFDSTGAQKLILGSSKVALMKNETTILLFIPLASLNEAINNGLLVSSFLDGKLGFSMFDAASSKTLNNSNTSNPSTYLTINCKGVTA